MESIISTSKLCKSFSSKGKQFHIIKNLDLEIEKGSFTVIMGSSGSGKSTLLYSISGMDKPSLGEVWMEGSNITSYSQDQLAIFRRKHCGFIFQQIHLINTMSVMDNILASGLLVYKNNRELKKNVVQLLTDVQLEPSLWNKFPGQLSGGEAQRVGIVRALINHPSLLFADEPTGALNSSSGTAVLDIMSKLNQQGQSIVMVTHDLKTAARGSRILYLRDGSISGDLLLGTYKNDDNSARMDQVKLFVERMGW